MAAEAFAIRGEGGMHFSSRDDYVDHVVCACQVNDIELQGRVWCSDWKQANLFAQELFKRGDIAKAEIQKVPFKRIWQVDFWPCTLLSDGPCGGCGSSDVVSHGR